ncbi:MAG: ABC transporter ATP-binding protein, partial [Paludibacteraceae bacterium]|nr:ABC transporter ATP-binding protein [Paludibacteraceae bacterium]
ILDEPTNDLDVTTLEVLEEYLIGFKGCILVVSHDRFFMDKVVDHILAFEGDGKIKDYPGNYTDYREWKALQEAKKAEEAKSADKQPQDKQPARRAHSSDAKRKMTFKEKREFEALDADINALETEKAEIEKAFADGLSDPDKITELSKRLEVINAELDEKSMRWLELSELD